MIGSASTISTPSIVRKWGLNRPPPAAQTTTIPASEMNEGTVTGLFKRAFLAYIAAQCTRIPSS